MKRSILFFIVFIFISLAANKEINAQIMSCNGTITCIGGADAWQSIHEKGTTAYSGNLGTETLKLTVDGKIAAQEMIITLDDWSDFVFKPDYNLMDLNSLESFIILNKHLPGLPKASSVEKDGIEVGNMQKILLQKIEELTLYIIELKKENQEIKKSINNKKVKK
jgi:hypothetical protein